MKKFVYLIILFTSVALLGCKDRNAPSNENNKHYGVVQFINTTSDPYSVSVVGNTTITFKLGGRSSAKKELEVGYYNFKVTQLSGYLLYPTVKEYEGTVAEEYDLNVSF